MSTGSACARGLESILEGGGGWQQPQSCLVGTHRGRGGAGRRGREGGDVCGVAAGVAPVGRGLEAVFGVGTTAYEAGRPGAR